MEQQGSSVSNSLEILAEEKNHAALMLAEVVGWLHDMKKCDEKHIQKFALDHIKKTELSDDDEEKISPQVKIESRYLSIPGESPILLQQLIKRGKPGAVKEISKQSWLVRALGFCHSAAHTEKEEIGYLLKQTMADTRLSSSFGNESDPLTGLRAKLDGLPLEQLPDRATLLSDIKGAFRGACADTQQPINDVTLWDWSNIVAAMYKAALAAALLGEREEPPNMHWRLLSVRLNGAAFSERAIRIPDLLARQELIADGLNNVRTLLDEKYPLGTEVYRDENGSVFIVPKIDSLLDLEDGQHRKLHSLIIDEFIAGTVKDDPALALSGEITPSLEYDTGEWTREMPKVKPRYEHQKPLPIAEHVKAEKLPSLKVDIHAVRSWWESQREPTCSVCQLRPQGWDVSGIVDQKALERKVCSICERRREDRSKRWITKDKLEKTIWIDEIADASGTLALIVGKLDLTSWLDGRMLFFPGIDQELFVDSLQSNVSVHGIRGRVGGHYRILLDKNIESVGQATVGDNWLINGQNFQVKRKESDDLGCLPVETVDSEAIQLVETQLLHPDRSMNEQHFKPLPRVETHTPVRLQRVWETTRKFWKDVEAQFGESKIFGKVPVRLKIRSVIKPVEVEGKQKTLDVTHTYEIRLGNVRMSVVYIGGGQFFSVDNLQHIAVLLNAPESVQKDYRTAADFVKDRLNEMPSLEVELPAGYGSSSNEIVGRLQNVIVTSEEMPYTPALTILSEPNTFMALVPADKALKVANAIKQQYESEMGKVRNRLPLTVGVVFASSRTPLPAILDSGRRILRQQVEDEDWKITGIQNIIEPPNPGPWPSKVRLTLEREQRQIAVTVPTVMGDEVTRDEWYPYWHMASPVADAWVHVCDLREGDVVCLMPSRFDFEWLDVAARRFEVSYEGGKRRGEIHPARPYYLEQLDDFKELWKVLSKGLATSQIHNLVGLIEKKRLEWHPDKDNVTFERIVRDILNNALWNPRPNEGRFEELVRAAISGQLTDLVEFYSFIDEELSKTVIDQMGGNL